MGQATEFDNYATIKTEAEGFLDLSLLAALVGLLVQVVRAEAAGNDPLGFNAAMFALIGTAIGILVTLAGVLAGLYVQRPMKKTLSKDEKELANYASTFLDSTVDVNFKKALVCRALELKRSSTLKALYVGGEWTEARLTEVQVKFREEIVLGNPAIRTAETHLPADTPNKAAILKDMREAVAVENTLYAAILIDFQNNLPADAAERTRAVKTAVINNLCNEFRPLRHALNAGSVKELKRQIASVALVSYSPNTRCCNIFATLLALCLLVVTVFITAFGAAAGFDVSALENAPNTTRSGRSTTVLNPNPLYAPLMAAFTASGLVATVIMIGYFYIRYWKEADPEKHLEELDQLDVEQ